MNDRDPHRNEEREVDLVPIFAWIGKGISNFFKAILAFFKAIGHGIILFLVFVQKNLIIIAIFSLLGLALGYYLDHSSKSYYTAQLRVAPNFNSASQLISNVGYYNSLADEGNIKLLASELDLSIEEAGELGVFTITPSYNDTELLEEYDQLARTADTMALQNLTFEGFKDAKRVMDYNIYEITATASSRTVLEKIVPQLVSIDENEGIKAARLAAKETIAFNISANEMQLEELDSLIASYKKMIGSNTSTGGNTNLYVGDQPSSASVMSPFYQKVQILEQLDILRKEKYRTQQTINIISTYMVQGNIEKEHFKLKFLIIFFVLGVLAAAIPGLWRYLKSYPNHS